jgi:hypothetical protein
MAEAVRMVRVGAGGTPLPGGNSPGAPVMLPFPKR